MKTWMGAQGRQRVPLVFTICGFCGRGVTHRHQGISVGRIGSLATRNPARSPHPHYCAGCFRRNQTQVVAQAPGAGWTWGRCRRGRSRCIGARRVRAGRPCARGRTVHPRPHTVNAGDARSTGGAASGRAAGERKASSRQV